ncbi:MAG: CHASE2 domain-containing protein [Scytolyngbya sp. HA4215-MV1]|jgi:CHASE2 domain-containing sensor protein|nr:CHASE2 domain-containing protein [Scytolyngbya sp. HA4215-MV1]
MLGTLLKGRYKIIRVLGAGGFGQTYVAEDLQQPDQSVCVVKHLKPSSQDTAFLQVARRLFDTEVETLRRLGSHDQIPGLLASFEDNQEFYFVQDFIEGCPLSEELSRNRRLSEAQVLDLLRDVLEILQFVHSKQVIHRDIKPSNLIRRQPDNKFVLIDFGAVKEIQTQITNESGKTGLTVGIGTQGYVPSEQLVGKPRFSSDLYALGMTAIQALTGLHPSQLPTHPDTAEVIWKDQTRISRRLEMILEKMVHFHFTQRFQSATEVLQTLDRMADPFNDFTLLPPTQSYNDETVLTEQALVTPEEWHRVPAGVWRKFSKTGWQAIAIASLAVTGTLLGARQLLVLKPLEMALFEKPEIAALDWMMRRKPDAGIDPRLLVVEITEADLREQKRFPLSDQVIAQTIANLNRYHPRAIGLDLLRDIPQEPGRDELLKQLHQPNVVVITKIGSNELDNTPPPPGFTLNHDQVGFNDIVIDPDDIVRRCLLFADYKNFTLRSFSLRLAQMYLKVQGIVPTSAPQNPDILKLGAAVFPPMEANAGGYQLMDARGYQILLNYRSAKNAARHVTLGQVLKNQVNPDWVKDKVILIGTTAPSIKDLFATPYGAIQRDDPKMPGVVIHAQMVSMILDAALNKQSLLWVWSEPIEILWIAGWTVVAGVLAWYVRRPLILIAVEFGVLVILGGFCWGIFTQHGWVPIFAPAVAVVLATAAVSSYGVLNDRQKSLRRSNSK